LGWARLVPAPSPAAGPDPTAFFDIDKLFDSVSLGLYQNAKAYYERCRKAFFDYAWQLSHETRRAKVQEHRAKARSEVQHAANLQLLGMDSPDEGPIERARREVEEACKHTWAIYQTSPTPKSDAVKIELLSSLAEAQLIGVDEVPITKTLEAEVSRLLNSGALGMVKR
jgi:hypothetical protein